MRSSTLPLSPSGIRAQWEHTYPSAVVFVADFESLTVHLRFPAEHWKRCRHTNLLERTFGETRRHIKEIGRLPVSTSESPSLSRCSIVRAADGAT